ncbi:Fur family transcriptional regulator [Nocardia brasiliensis]|uniref:Fur family transcriptional regulator n=1 Tax=Nocardia brasiliensis TaxID=37326 RepID=UPI0024559422|nr:transcriptional repressor [Nocardia brasiliensis]
MHTNHTDAKAQLRAAGLRVTAPRIAVLDAVAAAPHTDADRVAATVRQALGSVSTQAVYDVLRACVHAGILRRIEPAGSAALYETRTGDNHHHLVWGGGRPGGGKETFVGGRPRRATPPRPPEADGRGGAVPADRAAVPRHHLAL